MIAYSALPTVDDLSTALGRSLSPAEVEAGTYYLSASAAVAATYTRGRGFSADRHSAEPAIQHVVMQLAIRMMLNPASDQLMQAGSLVRRPGQPQLDLTDRLLLDQYRRATA